MTTNAAHHPDALALEAVAVGEKAAEDVTAHVDACEACRAFVERVGGVAREPMRFDPKPALDRARKSERTRKVVAIAFVAVPFAAAAGALLYVNAQGPGNVTPAPTAATVAMADPVPSATTNGPAEPETTFKGGVQVAVVRERAGAQDRFTDVVRVKPGDRLRVEVALDRPQAILAAVVGDDGSWLEVMPEGVREAGTHFSERSVRVDEHPDRGTVVVGAPDAVRRARVTGNYDGVRTLKIDWEGAP